jgi:hypothetical protein
MPDEALDQLCAAVAVIEGDVESSAAEWLAAWQYLINTGDVWRLQGYGRYAADLLATGLCECAP